ncbi:hypothetical protein MMYC01_203326 [Madurella mycetomatis]|uniref:Uncharacterized protein n=1 Tax=Madurella mycetomatis TaxID=100816 RepID=A0A175W943_9PEZI|nr:hypothetical protein MMYC01_203326 [Madurella mycetomatis]
MDTEIRNSVDSYPEHIADANRPPGLEEPLVNGAQPIPMSTFSIQPPLPARSFWKQKCSHSTMLRLYKEMFMCDSCKRWCEFGFVYLCTMDSDPLIMDAKTKGLRPEFDEIGAHFTKEMTLGKFGADARSKKYSLLNEMSKEQMCSYTPQQLNLLLSQRDHVHETISCERSLAKHPVFYYARQKYPDDRRPWVPDRNCACWYSTCHRCRRSRDKAWVSLNGVLNGDISPTVAVGFPLRYMGGRRYADAEVVKNIGYRPVPLVRTASRF